MTMQNYFVTGPNSTAINILRSWLTAVGVPARKSDVPGSDLTVGTADGGELEVQVQLGALQSVPGAVVVQAQHVTGRKLTPALEAFWSITDAAGYDRRQPVDRGVEPEANRMGNPRKLHYRDSAFDVIIRHTEFRRAVNPPNDRWKQYKSTMEKVAWSFMRLNSELCSRHGLDIQDLMQFARCYVVNFCTRYEIDTPVHYDNERKCYRYLQQRFNCDLRPILYKMERSTHPDVETVSLALYGTPDATLAVVPDIEDAHAMMSKVDSAYVSRNCELDLSSQAARKASAKKRLGELLEALPHDELVTVLESTSTNPMLDIGARKEAARRLRAHRADCGCA